MHQLEIHMRFRTKTVEQARYIQDMFENLEPVIQCASSYTDVSVITETEGV